MLVLINYAYFRINYRRKLVAFHLLCLPGVYQDLRLSQCFDLPSEKVPSVKTIQKIDVCNTFGAQGPSKARRNNVGA